MDVLPAPLSLTVQLASLTTTSDMTIYAINHAFLVTLPTTKPGSVKPVPTIAIAAMPMEIVCPAVQSLTSEYLRV